MVTDKRFRSYTACEDGAKGWCLLWFPAATQVQLARILHHFTCTSYRVAGGYSHVLEPFQYDSSSQKWREAASWHRWQEKYKKDCPSKCIFPDCPSQRLNWARPVTVPHPDPRKPHDPSGGRGPGNNVKQRTLFGRSYWALSRSCLDTDMRRNDIAQLFSYVFLGLAYGNLCRKPWFFFMVFAIQMTTTYICSPNPITG